MDPVQHFEIPAKDKEKVKKFYGDVFGWKFMDFDEMKYTMVYTSEVDEKQMCKEPNRINGGMTVDDPVSTPVIVITVKNNEESLAKAKAAGAEVILEPTKAGEIGIYSRIKDVEGNVIGLWEPL